MEALVVIGFILAVWIVVDVLALSRGVDSRPGFGDPRAPSGILTT